MARPISRPSAGWKVAARPICCGKLVALPVIRPCSASSLNKNGMPSRVFSSAYRWTAFACAAFMPRSWMLPTLKPFSSSSRRFKSIAVTRPFSSCVVKSPEKY